MTENVQEMFNIFASNYSEIIRSHLQKVGVFIHDDSELTELLGLDEFFHEALDVIISGSRMTIHCRDHFNLVQPVQCSLGVDERSGKPLVYQYVPILKVLESQLKKPDVYAAILSESRLGESDEDDYLADYTDGDIYHFLLSSSADPSDSHLLERFG